MRSARVRRVSPAEMSTGKLCRRRARNAAEIAAGVRKQGPGGVSRCKSNIKYNIFYPTTNGPWGMTMSASTSRAKQSGQRALAIGALGFTILCGAALPAAAQEKAGAESSSDVGTVVITGSRIRRTDLEAPS